MEREKNFFKNYNPTKEPMRDYDENVDVIVQDIEGSEENEELSPKIRERINKAERGEIKARLASILDRGVVQDRLYVDLPSNLHGEWVLNDPLEVNRLKLLGFRVDTEYAPKRSIHSDGTDSGVVGDVVHMICDREYKEIIDEIREEQKINTHRRKKIGNREVNREEMEFQKDVEAEGDDKVISYTNSSERTVTRGNLATALDHIDSQIKKSNL